MKSWVFTISFLFIFFTEVWSQPPELEKLWQIKNTTPPNSHKYLESIADLGDYYSKREILDSAFYYYYLAIPLSDSLNNLNVKHQVLTGLANSLLTKKDYEKALNYYKQCLDYYLSQKDTLRVIITYNNIALVYKNKKNYEYAKSNYEKALNLLKSLPKQDDKWYEQAVMLENNLANVHALLGDVECSIKILEGTLSYLDKIQNPIYQAATYLNLADRYIELSRFSEAHNFLQKSLQIGQQIQALDIVSQSYKHIAEIYEKTQNFSQALLYYKKYDSLDKKILNEANLKQINELENKYELAKKDQAILRKEKELEKIRYERNRNYLILGILVSLLITTIVGLRNLYLRNKRQQAEKKVVACELERTLMMQEELKSQQEALKHQLEYQQKELLSATLQKTQQHEAILQIKEYVKKSSDKSQENIQKIKQLISSTENLEKDWNEFKMRFEKIHENFFKHLQEKYPELTENDLRMCAFIKLHLDKKQIATLLNITPKAVEMSRYRLKKKLHLHADENLNKFIQNFE